MRRPLVPGTACSKLPLGTMMLPLNWDEPVILTWLALAKFQTMRRVRLLLKAPRFSRKLLLLMVTVPLAVTLISTVALAGMALKSIATPVTPTASVKICRLALSLALKVSVPN